MAATVRIELNRAGVRQLLRSDEALAHLTGLGDQIAAAAGDGHEVQPSLGPNRARVSVRTATDEARYLEATERNLTRAFGAAR
jgi:hypothetical protein